MPKLLPPCPAYVPYTQGSPKQTLPPSSRWLCVDGRLLRPPPQSCAGVISVCTKISFCQAVRLFAAAVFLSLPGDPAAPGDMGHWEVHRVSQASVGLPPCLRATEGGHPSWCRQGLSPCSTAPLSPPPKLHPLLRLGPPQGAPLCGCWGFPGCTRHFVLDGGQHEPSPGTPSSSRDACQCCGDVCQPCGGRGHCAVLARHRWEGQGGT